MLYIKCWYPENYHWIQPEFNRNNAMPCLTGANAIMVEGRCS